MRIHGKRLFTLTASMVIVLGLQGTLLYKFKIFGARPDLMMAIVGSIALLRGWSEGLVWGIFGGLLQDVMTGSLPGSHALAKSMAGFTLGLLKGKVFNENTLLPAVAIFLGSLMEGILFFIAAGTFGYITWNFLFAIRAVVFPTAFVTALIAPFVYRIYKRIYDPPRLNPS